MTEAAASCLRGDIAAGFSLVAYAGGSVEDLVACAEGRSVTALYVLDGGKYVSYIGGAPDFVNRPFIQHVVRSRSQSPAAQHPLIPDAHLAKTTSVVPVDTVSPSDVRATWMQCVQRIRAPRQKAALAARSGFRNLHTPHRASPGTLPY